MIFCFFTGIVQLHYPNLLKQIPKEWVPNTYFLGLFDWEEFTYFKKTTWKDIFDLLHITLSKVFLFHAAQHQKLCQIPGLVRAYAWLEIRLKSS